jgi:hypothetical protein
MGQFCQYSLLDKLIFLFYQTFFAISHAKFNMQRRIQANFVAIIEF